MLPLLTQASWTLSFGFRVLENDFFATVAVVISLTSVVTRDHTVLAVAVQA